MFLQQASYTPSFGGLGLSSPTLAITRQLIVMVGGDQKIFERIRPILDAFSDQVVYAGRLGTAGVLKVVTNMMGTVTIQAIAEGLTLGVKAGARLEDLLEVGSRTETSGGMLGAMKGFLEQSVFRGDFESRVFTLGGTLKDIGLATELGRESSVPMPVATVVEQAIMHAVNRGWADKELTASFLLQEEMAGVQLRNSPPGR